MALHNPPAPPGPGSDFMDGYLDALSLVERLHRLLLDVIKDEFERIGVLEINAVQALLLFNIGDNEVTAGELKTRGYYQGSNVSYNLKIFVINWHLGEVRLSTPAAPCAFLRGAQARMGESAGRLTYIYPHRFLTPNEPGVSEMLFKGWEVALLIFSLPFAPYPAPNGIGGEYERVQMLRVRQRA